MKFKSILSSLWMAYLSTSNLQLLAEEEADTTLKIDSVSDNEFAFYIKYFFKQELSNCGGYETNIITLDSTSKFEADQFDTCKHYMLIGALVADFF